MNWIIVATLLVVLYLAVRVYGLGKAQVILATFLEDQFKDIREAALQPYKLDLPFGWFDDGWPIAKVDEEERAPIKNPELRLTADEYAIATWIGDYRSLSNATE